MSPTMPFRFLDLPGELRNNIYDLLLCSWNEEVEYEPRFVGGLRKRSLAYDAMALLRTNKQIHNEASDYMMKRNQFVRVTCRGLDINSLFLGDEMIAAITTDSRKARQYENYLMHITLSKPATTSNPVNSTETEIMLLRADLPALCRDLDIETAMTDVNAQARSHLSISATVSLNPLHAALLTPAIQHHLLSPLATHLRGISPLTLRGPVSIPLAHSITTSIALPRWTDPKATLDSIHTGTDVGKRQWQRSSFPAASASWSHALRSLERMRHSSSWLVLRASGGEDFVNSTADLYFTLNLLHAAVLQQEMASPHTNRATLRTNAQACWAHLRKCETAAARFAQHADATWSPSNEQASMMLFRQARCLRLLGVSADVGRAVEAVEQAVVLAPNDLAIREEGVRVAQWRKEVDELVRVSRVRAEAEEVQRVSWWGTLRAVVGELAS
ncbi:hypothetical protein E8E13_006053 [Curvularia kusanoi]|uniref:Uncharacterized protein n=1 Tax=Curvularia kusanoi TaxID=90978 RepID=A0A9P4T9Q9_CURKU|nr:hypothetical protein E8E13_006053 [Curvularia kusanoi]